MTAHRVDAVLLDLDGVIRHFDPHHLEAVERANGLDVGVIWATAFRPDLIDAVTTGRMTKLAWRDRVGELIGSPAAARQWMKDKGTVDWELIAVVDQLRADGLTVAILTNGTDTIADELDELEVSDHFDAVFNSALIGHAKPDRRAFEHVCRHLDIAAERIFFTDDSESKLSGAIQIGMQARHYSGLTRFRSDLAEILA